MYGRGLQYLDPDDFASGQLPVRRAANTVRAALFELTKYLAITAGLYLFLVVAVGVL